MNSGTEAVKVLDHGSIRLVESWGSDESIIEAARMSTAKGFLGWGPGYTCPKCKALLAVERDMQGSEWFCPTHGRVFDPGPEGPGDEKLLRYLWENKHATPFEMAGATFEVKAPIFVFREWHRHRVPFGYNEMSARYVPLPDENYIPDIERLLVGSDGKNRQAGTVAGAGVLDAPAAAEFRLNLRRMYEQQEKLYQDALVAGVPKELARVHLPVGRYSRMRATGNLRGWLGFLALRSTAKNPSAQWEIRQYADALLALLARCFPRTLALFSEVPEHAKQKAFLRELVSRRSDLPADVVTALTLLLAGAGS